MDYPLWGMCTKENLGGDYLSDCERKIQFHSRSVATVSINYHKLTKSEPYFCNSCNAWHIGSVDLVARWKEDLKNR